MHSLLAQSVFDLVVDTIDALSTQLWPLANVLGWFVLWLLPVAGFCYMLYFLISLPMRRRERGGMFLDLIETGLRRGQNPERTIVAAAGTEDPALGIRFQMLAAHIENGLRLDQALDKVPRLLPPPIAATLKTGVEIGDIARVLPACRKQLKDGISQTRGALNYLLILVFMILPVFPLLLMTLTVWVLPRFQEIYKDMLPGVPIPCAWMFALAWRLIYVHLGLIVLLQVLCVCYVGGPRFKGWFKNWIYPFGDAFSLRLPWRRKRLQRDFSTMLAMLLDAGLTEARAVQLAAASTANRILEWRADDVSAALAEGVPLTEAVQRFDSSGELRWRLANAAHSRKGFLDALAGWIEALDAKAFQQEQTAAQLLTSGLVLFNGTLVGLFAVGVFMILTTMIREGALW